MAQQSIVRFEQGSVIMREGETTGEMYRIVSGHAEVYVGYETDNETIIGIKGPHSCFGEFNILLDQPSIYTVVAYSDLYALKITEETFDDFIDTNRHTVIEIMRNMAGTMMSMRFQIELLLKDMEAGKSVNEQSIMLTKKAMRSYGLFRPDAPAVPRVSIAEMLDKGQP